MELECEVLKGKYGVEALSWEDVRVLNGSLQIPVCIMDVSLWMQCRQ